MRQIRGQSVNIFTFTYKESAGIDFEQLAHLAPQLQAVTQRYVQVRSGSEHHTPMDFVNVPFADEAYEAVTHLVERKKKLNPAAILVIGIGGSHLGAAACYQACAPDQNAVHRPLIFVDTVDPDFVSATLAQVHTILHAGKAILINIITRSGSTLETIANAELFVALIKQFYPTNYHDYVVITTEKDSPLWHYAQQASVDCLEIPPAVGGRFSVFTPVGLFPLALGGINTYELLAGAQQMVDHCLAQDNAHNPAAVSAALLFLAYKKKIMQHDTFFFALALEGVGRWYRQLLAESIGKEKNKDGQIVNVGITPTVSLGTTDLHSVGQLYLGGPFNRFTTFVSYQSYEHPLPMPQVREFGPLSAAVADKSVAVVYQSILQGVQQAYKNAKRPFMSIVLPQKSAVYVGQFMQYAMMQVCYLGFLLDVDPFDQPEVERYKIETKKILSRG